MVNGAFAQSSQPCATCLPEGITFSTQAQIDNFQTNYPGCTEILGHLTIDGNDINNLNGLNVITSIGGALLIPSNPSLTNLTGLDNLTSIEGNVAIYGNTALISLTGLEGLTSIAGYIHIYDNKALTSLAGLDNITAGSITELYIVNNSSLSNCVVQSICNYLVTPNGTIEISDNTTGCNSEEEVKANCKSGYEDYAKSESHITIYPNPAPTQITIETPTTPNKNTILTIHNINGQVISRRQITEQQTVVNVSGLSQGIYVVRIVSDDGVMVGKFVKQ